MKNNKVMWVLLLNIALTYAQLININPDPNGDPWYVGGWSDPTPEQMIEIESYPKLIFSDIYNDDPPMIPLRWNNTTSKYFRSVFWQEGGSCAQASGIGYVFTYLMNYLNNADAADETNQYPTHYTYNFLNEGSSKLGTNYIEGWNIAKAGGIPNVQTYGGMIPPEDPEHSWMDGSDKYQTSLNRECK